MLGASSGSIAVADAFDSSATTATTESLAADVLQASLTLQGVSELSADLDDAICQALAGTLGVEAWQVSIVSSEPMRGDARRLVAGMQVTFEVVLAGTAVESSDKAAAHRNTTEHQNGQSTNSPALTSASDAFENLKLLNQSSDNFQKQLLQVLEANGDPVLHSVKVTVGQPVLQRREVKRVAGPWSPCRAADDEPCAGRGRQGRAVSCRSTDHVEQPASVCKGLPELPAARDCSAPKGQRCTGDDLPDSEAEASPSDSDTEETIEVNSRAPLHGKALPVLTVFGTVALEVTSGLR